MRARQKQAVRPNLAHRPWFGNLALEERSKKQIQEHIRAVNKWIIQQKTHLGRTDYIHPILHSCPAQDARTRILSQTAGELEMLGLSRVEPTCLSLILTSEIIGCRRRAEPQDRDGSNMSFHDSVTEPAAALRGGGFYCPLGHKKRQLQVPK